MDINDITMADCVEIAHYGLNRVARVTPKAILIRVQGGWMNEVRTSIWIPKSLLNVNTVTSGSMVAKANPGGKVYFCHDLPVWFYDQNQLG